MLKAVLFDVDGTLAETEEFHRCAFNAAFAEHWMPISWSAQQYRELLRVTGGKERLAHYFQGQTAAPSAERIGAAHASKNALYVRNLVRGETGLRPGVVRLLGQVRKAGLRLGIATTTAAVNLDALLKALLGLEWSKLFACVVAGDQVARKKPAPETYLACLKRLGLQASEAVAIEDSSARIASARAAGIVVLATPSLYTLGEDFGGADCVVPDLGEPDRPWPSPIAGFAQRWVDVAGLRNLVEIAQQVRLSAPAVALVAR